MALHAVRRGRVAGQRVLIVGAGPIGLLAAQCARAEGAASVVVTDTREDRLTLAAALGFPRASPLPGEAHEIRTPATTTAPSPRAAAGATPRRSRLSSTRSASRT